MVIDKPLVQKKFNYGLHSYNNHADIQKGITDKFVGMLKNEGYRTLDKVYEVGCGTGFLTQQLLNNFNIKQLTVNDLSCSSSEYIKNISLEHQRSIEFACGDAELLEIPEKCNAVVSTSAFQWFSRTDLFLAKVSRALNRGDLFAFSTFGPQNYREIKNITGVGLSYYSSTELATMLADNFTIIDQVEWIESLEFDTPMQVLQHMKQTGVNGVKNGAFGKKQLNEFSEQYTRLYTKANQKIGLSYHPIIFITQKK